MSSKAFSNSIDQFKFELSTIAALGMILLFLPYGFAIESYFSAKGKPSSSRFASTTLTPQTTVPMDSPAATPPLPPTQDTAVWPIHGRITADYGVPHAPWQRYHSGIDISSGKRSGATPIVSFKAGKVTHVGRSTQGYGNHVIVDHGGGLTSLYAHLSRITVQIGQQIAPGEQLGFEGSSGMTTGPHLHFEIRVDGKAVNPRSVLTGNP